MAAASQDGRSLHKSEGGLKALIIGSVEPRTGKIRYKKMVVLTQSWHGKVDCRSSVGGKIVGVQELVTNSTLWTIDMYLEYNPAWVGKWYPQALLPSGPKAPPRH